MKLQVVSPVRFIGAGIPKEGYKHILSFRRQVYVVCNEHDKLPDSLVIQFRGNAFRVFLTTDEIRVFLTTDEIRCFQCKRIGHVASKCPTNSDNSVGMETMDVSLVPLPDRTELQELSTKENTDTSDIAPPSKKRQAEPSTPTDTSDIAPPSKKRQAEPSTPTESEPRALLVEESNSQCPKVVDTDRFLKPISKKKEESNSQCPKVVDTDRFLKPIKEVKGKQDTLAVARSYTNDIGSLIELLIRIVRVVKTSNLKSRIKRLTKKLKNGIDPAMYQGTFSQDDIGSLSSQGDVSDTSEC
ncbi:hypothetical protein QE152_g7209 [Popillia japonica]|uniref:CCHC-type domain-containing protein n=1 Tax=Popillia japonica TaxID=7064 RepID=A0AAW1MG53_POPJA